MPNAYNRLKKSDKLPIQIVASFNIRKNLRTSVRRRLKCPAYVRWILGGCGFFGGGVGA